MGTSTHRMTLVAAVMTITMAACGGSDDTSSTATTAADATTTTAEATTTTSAGPTYRILSEAELTAALLDIQDLPAGYAEEPPADQGSSKTFCDYKPPYTEKIRVRQNFTKGGGLSTELLSTGLRQYATPDEARAAWDAMVDALETCTEETYDGSHVTYSPMSAPRVGDASVGVKINFDGTDVLQFFALVGPTLVNTGGGGLMNASAEDLTHLLEAQVGAYQEAATS